MNQAGPNLIGFKVVHIGIYTPNYPSITGEGGIGTYTRHLAHALSSIGHRVHVLTNYPIPGQQDDGPVTVHQIPARYFRLVDRFLPGAGACWRICQAMRKLVRDHRLEIVEFPNWEGWGFGLCLFRPVPLVVRLHTSTRETQEIDGVPDNRRLRWDIRREGWLAQRADTLVTHSQAHRQRMAEELHIAADRIEVVPHGLPMVPGFSKQQRPQEPPTVVFVGRMEKRKGTPTLLEAIPEVLREIPDVRFVLIGADRPHCPGGRTHAEYFGAQFPGLIDRVHFAGRLPDGEVEYWLQQADLFVAPSLYESFGLVFLEAMRWGTPVIGTTAGGIPEIVEHGRTGWLVRPGDVQDLTRAIVHLLRNPIERDRLGEAGKLHAEKHFSIDRAAVRVAELYRQTLEQARKGRQS